MKKLTLGAVALLTFAAVWPLARAQAQAQAQETSVLRTRALAATCAACHGTEGRAIEGAAVPGLAGLPAAYMVEQMKGFKSGARTATVMHQLAKGYSDAQIEQLGVYFAALPKTAPAATPTNAR